MAVFTQDITEIGGLEKTALVAHFEKLKPCIAELVQWKKTRKLPMLCLPEDEADLSAIEAIGNEFRKRFANVLVVGTGGSSLGGQTVAALKDNPFAPGRLGAPKLYFLDNVDPHTMDTLLATLDLAQTGCVVISKSGGTAEIVAQALVLISAFTQKLGAKRVGEHFISITIPAENPLRSLSKKHGIRVFDHDPAVGGRFSVLSLVGLIPAVIAGVNARLLRKGAASVMKDLERAVNSPEASPAVVGAAVHYALMQKGYNIAVLMPYCDRLAYFGMWFRQTWAESLGKNGLGSTPIRALGTVDQHSQLQLYLDGPKDKFFTLVLPEVKGRGATIPAALVGDETLAYIRDKAIGDVMAAHQHGTTRTLANNHCPVRVLRIKEVNEEVLGALLMHVMLETILTAHLLGINAYDQPAVEESKVLARDYLSNM